MAQRLFLVVLIIAFQCYGLNCKETIRLWKTQEKYFDQPQAYDASVYNPQENDYDIAQSLLSNGDIRLSTNIVEEEDDNGNKVSLSSGRLEVYVIALLEEEHARSAWSNTPGVWGTVCGASFSMVEAHVACKQLGYEQALKWELSSASEFGQGNGSRPIFLNGINCPNSDSSHIMRCRATEEPSSSCSHDSDVTIYCDESKSSYSGQVRLVSEVDNSTMSVSSGRVEVYQNGVWGTVCINDFNQAAADTVCRQLGYTNALEIYNAIPGDDQVLVDYITCTSSSSCFKSCFNSHHLPHQCNHTSDVAIQCTYDISLAMENTSGNESQCKIGPHPFVLLLSIAILTLSSLLVLGVIASASICVACYIFRKRKQTFKLYEPLS